MLQSYAVLVLYSTHIIRASVMLVGTGEDYLISLSLLRPDSIKILELS